MLQIDWSGEVSFIKCPKWGDYIPHDDIDENHGGDLISLNILGNREQWFVQLEPW